MTKPLTPLALLCLGTLPLSAQWAVKVRRVSVHSQDNWISLEVELPVAVGDGDPQVRKAINHALGVATKVDQLKKDAEGMVRAHDAALKRKQRGAGGDDDADGDDFTDEHSITVEKGLSDDRILSLCLDGYWHGGGGAVGNPYAVGCTFDAATGRSLGLSDLLSGAWKPALDRLAIAALKDQAEELFDGWEAKLPDSGYGFFLNQAHALVLRFPKYSIGPGAAGVISAEIPLSRLKPFIAPGSPLEHLLKDGR